MFVAVYIETLISGCIPSHLSRFSSPLCRIFVAFICLRIASSTSKIPFRVHAIFFYPWSSQGSSTLCEGTAKVLAHCVNWILDDGVRSAAHYLGRRGKAYILGRLQGQSRPIYSFYMKGLGSGGFSFT